MTNSTMTLGTARATVELFIEDDGEWADTALIMRAVHALDDGDEDDQDLARRAFDAAPGLINYDEFGNWIGPVPLENGYVA